jgi:hypothetical protein
LRPLSLPRSPFGLGKWAANHCRVGWVGHILIFGLWGVEWVLIVLALCVTIAITIAIQNRRWEVRSLAGRRSAFGCVVLHDRTYDHWVLLGCLANSGRAVAYNPNFAAPLSSDNDAARSVGTRFGV